MGWLRLNHIREYGIGRRWSFHSSVASSTSISAWHDFLQDAWQILFMKSLFGPSHPCLFRNRLQTERSLQSETVFPCLLFLFLSLLKYYISAYNTILHTRWFKPKSFIFSNIIGLYIHQILFKTYIFCIFYYHDITASCNAGTLQHLLLIVVYCFYLDGHTCLLQILNVRSSW